MRAYLLLQQMLVLFAMMITGFWAYRMKWIDRQGGNKLTTLIVKLFNPMLILSSVLGDRPANAGNLLGQDLLLASLYFIFIILGSHLFCKIRRYDRRSGNIYILLTTFGNLGFMGIPIVRAVYGPEYIIYVVIYLLIFNILAYTYGIWLAMGMSPNKRSFSPVLMVNSGLVICVIAVICFLARVKFPAPVVSFCTYMGDCAIPLSMIVIGISLAQSNLKELLFDKDTYIFLFFRMLLLPAAGILIFKLLPFHKDVYVIFTLMISMPAATIGGMLAQEFAGRGNEASKIILLSTVISVFSIPLLSLL